MIENKLNKDFEPYPSHSLRIEDEVWQNYLIIKKRLGKNHNHAIKTLVNKYKEYD